jgi:hypothetical protein
MFRLTRCATRGLPETRVDLDVRQVRRTGYYCGWRLSQCRQPVRNMEFAERDDTAALRQNAAVTFRGVRLALARNHTLFAVRYVNLYFRWEFPNLNI